MCYRYLFETFGLLAPMEALTAENKLKEISLPLCPVQTTLQVIGGKWKPAILWNMDRGTIRFGELKRSLPGITQKMLTQQLRELEEDGIIWRKVYAEVPPRVEYGITEYGQTLRSTLHAMARWGEQHQQKAAAGKP